MDRGFKIVTFNELRKMKVSTMEPRPRVVFVNRRKAFQPPVDTLEKYNKLKKMQEDNPYIDPQRGDIYKKRYWQKIIHSSDAMTQLRRLAEESRKRLILMVKDKDRPDGEILVELATHLMNGEVW